MSALNESEQQIIQESQSEQLDQFPLTLNDNQISLREMHALMNQNFEKNLYQDEYQKKLDFEDKLLSQNKFSSPIKLKKAEEKSSYWETAYAESKNLYVNQNDIEEEAQNLKQTLLESIQKMRDQYDQRVVNFDENPNQSLSISPQKERKGIIFESLQQENQYLKDKLKKLEQSNKQLKKQLQNSETIQNEYIDKFLAQERKELRKMITQYKQFLDKLLSDKQKLTKENRHLKNEIYNLNEENQKYSEVNKNLTKEINFLIDRYSKAFSKEEAEFEDVHNQPEFDSEYLRMQKIDNTEHIDSAKIQNSLRKSSHSQNSAQQAKKSLLDNLNQILSSTNASKVDKHIKLNPVQKIEDQEETGVNLEIKEI